MATNILAVHNEAMDISQLGDISYRKGDTEQARQYYVKAYELELEAISMLNDTNSNELGQAVMLKSAANLAVLCGKGREAEQLVGQAIRKDIPDFLMEELRGLLKQVDALAETANDDKEIIELEVPYEDRFH